MKQLYSNLLTMLATMLASVKKDQAAWSGETEIAVEIAAIETEYHELKTIIDQLSGLDSRGYTDAGNQEFELIVSLTLKLCKKLCVAARRTNDSALLQLANHSQSSLHAGKHKEVISRCTAIVNKAESKFGVVQSYKVTLDEITIIRQHISTLDTNIDNRSNVNTDKTTLNQHRLPELVHSIRERLIILDDMVEGFIDDEDVVARYKQSRVTVNYGKSKTAKNQTGTATVPVQ